MQYLLNLYKFLLYPFSVICFFAYSANLPASDSLPTQKTLPLADYFTQTWTTHDGLPHNGINAISQTTDGYLWIGTWEGLARFNGRNFKVFTRGSVVGLPDSSVKSLTTTQNGKLLVAGARGGLSERSNNQWFPKPLAATMINHAIYDDKNLWLALEGKGLVYRNTSTKEDTVIINNIRVYKVLLDNKKTLWVATNKGLYSVTNKTIVRHFDKKYGLPSVPFQDLLLTQNKQLIVASQQGVFKRVNNYFQPLHPQLSHERVSSLLQDNTGNIWLGTDNHGVFRLNNSDNTLERLDDNNGLPNNKVSSLYQDNEQSIWVGTSSGLFRLREAPFITLTTEQGLSGNYVRSVLSHSDGSLWVGNNKGLNKINNGVINTISVEPNNSQLSVLSLAETPEKQVLVGTYNQGLYIVTNNQLHKLMTTDNGLPSNEVRSILIDSSKNLWLGTASGLVKVYPDKTIEVFNKQSGLPTSFIMALIEDNYARVWIGTGDGIASYNNGIIQTYRLNEEFNAEYAFGFYIEKNALWVATDRGLIHIDLTTNKMSVINKSNGLPVDKIFQIVIDNKNTFWLTSNSGIISIARAQLNNILQEKTKHLEYRLFTEGVGLLNFQANGGSTPAATLHHDGSIWIATAKGVSHVNHQRLKRMAETNIPVVIEQLNADGISYPVSPNLELPEGASRITIGYAGLSYLMAEHIEYQTQLIGFDRQWQNNNNQTFTEFTNLPPGNYTFKIRAKYPNGKWQENTTSLSFTIMPFYWQTTLFKLFVIFSLSLCLFIVYRYRVIRIKQNQIKLQALVDQQTIELQKQAELFSYQATHDQLTGLFNRRAFDEWCNDDFAKAKMNNLPLTLAIIDIDHFKRVNDEYSHLVGDLVIKKMANIIQKLIDNNTYQIKLARWGGEEFTLLISNKVEKSYDFCELLRASIKNYDFSEIAKDLNMTISIGLTDNNEVTEYNKMIYRADQALYFAKNNGRNQVKIYQGEEHDQNEKVNKRISKVTRAQPRTTDN